MSRQYFLAALIVLSMLLVPLTIAPKVQAILLCPAPATICWGNTSGGSWETVASWMLEFGLPAGRLPNASDDVDMRSVFPGSYTVTISSVQTVNSIHVPRHVDLACAPTCTLTIKSHTPMGTDDIDNGYMDVSGNVANYATLSDLGTNINILSGGTFVNFNSLDVSNGELFLHLNGVFVQKCNSLLNPIPPNPHIGGAGTFLAESPCPTQVSTASGSQVSGTVTFGSDLGAFTSLTSTALSSISPAPPSGLLFPDGLFSFTVSGLAAGATVTVTITLPSPLPAGAFSYWKFHGGSWQQMPASKVSLDSTRTIITLQLTDGATPDDSDSVAGQITDPGGSAITPTTGVSYYPVGGIMLPSVGFTVLLPWAVLLSLLGLVSVKALAVKHRAKRR